MREGLFIGAKFDDARRAEIGLRFLVEDVSVGGGPPLFPPEVEAVDEVAGEPLLPDLGPGLILFGVPESGEAG